MIRIIAGKRYNTEAATKVAENESSEHQGDFKYFIEALYVTDKGNWFLAGEGGAMSKYGKPSEGNARTWGSDLSPVSADHAKGWLEANDFTDELEKYFGDDIEDA